MSKIKEDLNQQLLFSLSKANGDFVVQPFKGSGKGGQKRNKTMSACRISHPASGTVSECQEERSYEQNKKKAFKRLLEKESFQKWYRIECAHKKGLYADIQRTVTQSMRSDNLLIETNSNGVWIPDCARSESLH